MDLTTPVDHADAYTWAAVALAHMMIGLVCVAIVAALITRAAPWIEGRGRLALAIVACLYLMVWEIGVQAVGAGWADALTDAAFVAAGGAVGLLAWQRRAAALGLVLVAGAAALWDGINRRAKK
jgi:hypothetical protein